MDALRRFFFFPSILLFLAGILCHLRLWSLRTSIVDPLLLRSTFFPKLSSPWQGFLHFFFVAGFLCGTVSSQWQISSLAKSLPAVPLIPLSLFRGLSICAGGSLFWTMWDPLCSHFFHCCLGCQYPTFFLFFFWLDLYALGIFRLWLKPLGFTPGFWFHCTWFPHLPSTVWPTLEPSSSCDQRHVCTQFWVIFC